MLRYCIIFAVIIGTVLCSKCDCDRTKCPPVTFCPSGYSKDPCECCEICLKNLADNCDYSLQEGLEPVNGKCGEFLQCERGRRNPGVGTCGCAIDGAVCGSDGITYDTLCHLLAKTTEDQELTVLDRAPCRKGPVIKTAPKDARRRLDSVLLMDCEAYGFPVPTVKWELNREDGSTIELPSDDSLVAVQIRGGPERNMVTGWVQIMKITPYNVGIYTCIATNAEGETRASATISYYKDAKKYEM